MREEALTGLAEGIDRTRGIGRCSDCANGRPPQGRVKKRAPDIRRGSPTPLFCDTRTSDAANQEKTA